MSRTARTSLAQLSVLLSVLSARPLPGQGDAVPTSAAAVAQQLRACVDACAAGTALLPPLERYRQALGVRAEAATIATLLDGLADGDATAPPLAAARADALLDRVADHRRRGHPERLLPVLLLLQRQLPEDGRVLFALGEAFGAPSPLFDAQRASEAFRRLSELQLADGGGKELPPAVRALVAFLPELGGADRVGWLQDRARGFCTALRDNQPLSACALRSLRMAELQEDLRVVLPRGFQQELVDALQQMRAVHPDDPAACHMLALVHASMGPQWQPERSIELLREFLDLTAEHVLQPAGDEPPAVDRNEIANRLSGIQLADAEDRLQAFRIAAKELLIQLTPAKGKPQPQLFFPELAELQKTTRELQKAMAKDNAELQKSQAKIDKLRSELEAARAAYERWRQQSAGSRRGVADPQAYVDAISSRKEALARAEKKHAPLAERVGDKQAWLSACEARLQQFGR